MLDQGEIDEIRAESEDLLPDTGRILTHAQASDGGGGQTETYTPGGELRCRIAPVGQRGESRVTGGKVDESTTHIATFPAATIVRVVDHVEINGIEYAVTALRNFGALDFTRRVEIREV